MKTIKLIGTALVSTILLGNLAFAQGTINQRERRQQERIADGVKDGELTQKEARKLERQQAKIHKAEAKAKADGEFTAKERAKIQKRQNKASRQIYKEKHDNQTR
jgi:polyhydroxyalkanoate synthesis regulator phasin